ncbi:DUF4326 domain-containing protein [Kaustia mangrovi]|uniref:DUF4326 domain-containing protein n=1 Tax=Kaustia mangrovi TaxID=2593653 RepID=A0A7S8C5X8_9HYPH|nr:DUF4326 domain-containing protein [Kaustia mangrovi]QPC43988.1 DUF4326 domain-containing protein [Kaustia mangrovi]
MAERPRRIQRKRTKGWRMPPGAVYVGRPTKWGNPFTVEAAREAGYRDGHAMAVHAYREWLRGNPLYPGHEHLRDHILTHVHDLAGKDLVCWCPLDEPCHADILMELANDC